MRSTDRSMHSTDRCILRSNQQLVGSDQPTMVEIDQNNETSQNIGLIQRKNARIAASGSLWYKLPEYTVKSGLRPIKYRFL